MGIVQKDAFRTMLISYIGIILGYLNKGFLFLLILSTEQIGLINLIVSIGLLFAQFSNLGAIYTTWKFFPFFRNKEKNHHGFLPLILIIVLIGILICLLTTIAFKPQITNLYAEKSPIFNDYYYWFVPIGISTVLYMIFEIYLRGFYKNIVAVIANEIILRVVILVLLLLLNFKLISFYDFVIYHSLAYVIPVILLLVYLNYLKELNFKFSSISISKKFKKILIQFSIYNYVNTLGVVLVNSLDIIMIAQFLGLKAAGVYSTVVFLTNALQVPFRSIFRVSSPLVADHWKNRDFDKMRLLYQNVSSVSIFIGLLLFLPIWNNIDLLFSFLKPEFQDGIWVFFWLMIGKLIDMYFGINGSIFSTSKKFKYDIYFTLFLIGTVYVLNLFFIPKWGIVGAALSTTFALVFYNFGRMIFVWTIFKMHPFKLNQFKIIALAIFTLVSAYFIAQLKVDKWMLMGIQFLNILTCFLMPIYFFNLESESIQFIKKRISKFKKSNS